MFFYKSLYFITGFLALWKFCGACHEMGLFVFLYKFNNSKIVQQVFIKFYIEEIN